MINSLYKEIVEYDADSYTASVDKIVSIADRSKCPYFKKTSEFLLDLIQLERNLCDEYFIDSSFDELLKQNYKLFEDVVDKNYSTSFINSKYALETIGEEFGFELSYLSYAIRECITAVYEHNKAILLLAFDLFLEVYEIVSKKLNDAKDRISQSIADFEIKRSMLNNELDIIKQNDIKYDYYKNISTKSDFTDLRYLFKYGKYISKNEIESAKYINSLSSETISKMADAYVIPYIQSFKRYGKKFEGFRSVLLVYPIGFERVIAKSIEKFREYGLESCVCNVLFSKKPTKQMKYDHRLDDSIYISKEYTKSIIEHQEKLYEKHIDIVSESSGYAMTCTFGESLFSPEVYDVKFNYIDEQKKAKSSLTMGMFNLKSKYVPRAKTSYTAIGYPIPEIGRNYKDIFNEMIEINTLDNDLYTDLHQNIISVLDEADIIEVIGKGENKTNLSIKMQTIEDIAKQTNFFNCVASVNVPVGEVFTSPKLEGTNGMLHVSSVYLMGMLYENLKIEFKDGIIVSYTCSNFENDIENKSYIKENLLDPHETLPMGEFAIGTNTRAYTMAKKYDISQLLPVLIAEKTGPHFAIGDTCYRGRESVQVYNQDGREITAKGNGYGKYTGKHTDITIPFEEIAEISIVKHNGERVSIIRDGLFVVEKMDELNKYLK